MANAFLSRFYGSVYASTALSKASSLPDVPNNLHKNFAQQARNVEMGLYYLAIRDSIQAEIAVEQGISRKNQTRMTISATPNPFNPSTHVLISGLSTDNKPVKLSIFSTNGTLLRNYLLNKTATLAEAEIDASDYGTGVYLIKCTDGARTTALKVSLIR
jgi:hypothetical protein